MIQISKWPSLWPSLWTAQLSMWEFHLISIVMNDLQSSPYCMRKDSSEKLTGNAQFEGYSLDLIHEISKILGFNYTFRLVPDGKYGSLNRETKEWDGMMKELLDQVLRKVYSSKILENTSMHADFVYLQIKESGNHTEPHRKWHSSVWTITKK